MPSKNRTYETARTRQFRASELDPEDERTISSIEEYGCYVVQVSRSGFAPGWSYTIGVFDSSGKPEIITVGLLETTALCLLDEAVRRLRAGVNLEHGRHRDMIAEVECEFRPVDPKWVRHLMDWALWYYDGPNFPVLQAVYPDRENRFSQEKPGLMRDSRSP